MITNGVDEANYTVDPVPRVQIDNAAEGVLKTWFIFTGTISIQLDLKRFPLDDNSIDVRLAGSRLRDGSGANAEEFRILAADERFLTAFIDSQMNEYHILGMNFVEYTLFGYTYITFGINIRRRHFYYFFSAYSFGIA